MKNGLFHFFMHNLLTLNRFFLKYRWHLLWGVVFVSISNYFRILQPRVVRDALNMVLTTLKQYKVATPGIQPEIYDQLTTQLTQFAGLVLLYALLMGLFMYFMRQTLIVMSRHIEYDMRKELFDHYLTLDHSFFVRNRVGDLMARISDDISKVRMYVGPGIMYMINLISLAVLIIYAMYSVSPYLTLFALLPLPVLSVSIYFISKIIQKRSTEIQQQLGVLTSTAQETFSGIRVLKVFVKEHDFKRYFNREASQLFDKNMKMTQVRAWFFPLIILLIGLSNLLTISIGGKLLQSGDITAGNLAEFVIYINMLTWPFTAIGWIASIVQEAAASQRRILDILNTNPKLDNQGTYRGAIEGPIRFHSVGLKYESENMVLKDLSFEIDAGQKVAIVGKTGSGKSSIADLLLRVMDPSEGEIFVASRPLQSYDIQHLRQQIGYVPQDTFLFSETIRNNIGFGSSSTTIKQIQSAAKMAGIHDEIMRFEAGYETLVGERGVSLSGGQKQRIAIARALIKSPKILILDDALSAVDPTTRSLILNNINSGSNCRTLISITHNFIHLDDFDNILVLEGGSISQSGTMQELLQDTDGYFYRLYQHQKRKEKNLAENP